MRAQAALFVRQEQLLVRPSSAAEAQQPAAAGPAGNPGPSPEPMLRGNPAREAAAPLPAAGPAAVARPSPEQMQMGAPETLAACALPPAAAVDASKDPALAKAQGTEIRAEDARGMAAVGSGDEGAAAGEALPGLCLDPLQQLPHQRVS